MGTVESLITELKPLPTLCIRFTAAPHDVGATFSQVLPEVFLYVHSVGIEPAGAPYARYHDIRDDALDIEAGIPVERAAEGNGRIVAGELPGGPVASAWHTGPYEGLQQAFSELVEFARKQGREPAGPHWESYITDPGQEPDPSRWLTEIVLPLKP